jgi:hypothetical protein
MRGKGWWASSLRLDLPFTASREAARTASLYIYATHHAVWHAPPDGRLVDVTPYPEEKHRPIQPSGCTLFLVDSAAQPIRTENQIAPLPLKFFALGDDPALAEYLEKLNHEGQERCVSLSGK